MRLLHKNVSICLDELRTLPLALLFLSPHRILPLALPSVLFELPCSYSINLIKLIYLIPLLLLQPLLLALLFQLATRLVPRCPSLLLMLSGRCLPWVIHLSLLTWPLTGLLGRLSRAAGKVTDSFFFCHGDIPEQSRPEGFGLE